MVAGAGAFSVVLMCFGGVVQSAVVTTSGGAISASETVSSKRVECSHLEANTHHEVVDVSETALHVANVFAAHGYSKAATAGVLGNLQAESGMRADHAEIGGGGFGLAQWTPRSKIRVWFDAHGLGNVPDSDVEGQARMLAETAESSFNNVYLSQVQAEGVSIINGSLKDTWLKTDDPQVAAITWMAGWERPAWASRNEQFRRTQAMMFYQQLGSVSFTAQPGVVSSSTGRNDSCQTPDTNSNAATVGTVGGAPQRGLSDFGWMCQGSQHICSASDAGVLYAHLEAGHQCVWYAWNRLAMIHGMDGWNWVRGNGGEIGRNVRNQPGWTVDTSPRPGDGVSGNSAPFSGPPPGHVAVVEEVVNDASGWRIRISEGNADGSASWNSYRGDRWISKAQAGDILFFRHQQWK